MLVVKRIALHKREIGAYRHDCQGIFAIHAPEPRGEIHRSEDLRRYPIVSIAHGRHTRIHADATQLSLIGARSQDR